MSPFLFHSTKSSLSCHKYLWNPCFLSIFTPPILASRPPLLLSWITQQPPNQILSLLLTLNPFNIESILKTHLGGHLSVSKNPAIASCGTWSKIWISNPGPEILQLICLCLSFQTHFPLIFSFSSPTFIFCCSLTHCWLYLHGSLLLFSC